ncbi:hypothetical protein [Chelativorans sp. AA-79]|uniref:hypothetical protein n=1 Tax=Chelativorans sp. AA-79 TaxID=3028735 RepID=UPI0023F62BD8|nr:hypothetical protein [Chelativorans sp. AA-79]WEX07347.1 hypothetical protein PVE73_14550 [Chelativorans sp. AA-79]
MRPLTIPCLMLAAGLAGCATITPEEQRALDEENCRSYGFRPGTDAFAECLQRIDLDRRAERRYRMAEFDRWDPDPVVVYRPIIVRRD